MTPTSGERSIKSLAAIVSHAEGNHVAGRDVSDHGVWTNDQPFRPGMELIAERMNELGYRTGAFGKVHFYPHFRGVHPDYRPFGFDVCRNTEDARAGEWLDWIEHEHPEWYEAALATIWPTEIAELRDYGPDSIDLRKRILEVRERFDLRTNEFPENDRGAYTLPFPKEISQTEWITRGAEAFIRAAEPGQPLFAQVSYVQPHSPFCPPGEYLRSVDAQAIPVPAPIEWIEDESVPRWFDASEGARRELPADWRRRRSYYFADVVHLDEQLGRILSVLEETGRIDDTTIIFLSDHGELLFDHGFTGKAERHYDACIRVPLVVSGPGAKRGHTAEEIVQHEDIFPTVLEIAGIESPAPRTLGPYLKEHPEAYPGRSLMPAARGDGATVSRDTAYIESYNNIDTALPHHWARTVRTSRWRYTLYPSGGGEQLFDLEHDPDEQRNLAASTEHAGVRTELRDRLLELVILQDYPQPVRNLFAVGVH